MYSLNTNERIISSKNGWKEEADIE